MPAATQQVNVRLEPQLAAALRAEAARSKRTQTAVLTEALEVYLAIVTPAGKGRKA